MNAVIALCHFCESHGPCSIFCTQTLRDTKLEDLQDELQGFATKCCCTSLGESNAIYSTDKDSEATFLSTQNPALPEVAHLVKQAAMRSLSSEVSHNKDGGFVFFGDSSRGHVLSHTFHIYDMQVGFGCYMAVYSIFKFRKIGLQLCSTFS